MNFIFRLKKHQHLKESHSIEPSCGTVCFVVQATIAAEQLFLDSALYYAVQGNSKLQVSGYLATLSELSQDGSKFSVKENCRSDRKVLRRALLRYWLAAFLICFKT